jgi:hypothetical protein
MVCEFKEPKKFELKKNEQKATKFWSGPPQKVSTACLIEKTFI